MDRKSSSPERISPGTPYTTLNTDSNSDNGMAAMVAHPNPSNMPGGPTLSGVNKRYRPAPAKTFQCKGFGDCRMVFSRSEHLARHIRKHTGERPFTCHCSKQFSRLDNLRQHAQTVHADKQDQNERMMRELTSLHASMAAANKVGTTRGARRTSGISVMSPQQSHSQSGSSPISTGPHTGSPNHSPVSVDSSLSLIKEEPLSLPLHHRQDSEHYDADDLIYHNQTPSSWGIHGADPLHHQRPSSRNGFRHDTADVFSHSQSYLSYSPPPNFGLPTGDAPRSRPGTASGKGTHSLPPLSAIIPEPQDQASLHEFQQQQLAHHQQQQQGYVPSAIRPRPGTASGRPGSSSAASLFSASKQSGTNNNNANNYFGAPVLDYNHRSYSNLGGYDADNTSQSSQDPSPFYFHPDDSSSASGRSPSSTSARSESTALTPPANHQVPSRKRTFGGPDGPLQSHYDELHYQPQQSPAHQPVGAPQFVYDYGSESRPQSRRLTVLELCNDGDPTTSGAGNMLDAGAMFGMNMNGLGVSSMGPIGHMNGFLEGRPTTAQIASAASALAIFDNRDQSRSPSGSSTATRGTHHGVGPGAGAGRIGPERERSSPAASIRSHGSGGGRQSVRPDRMNKPSSRKVTPTVAAAGGAYSHSAHSPQQGYHQPSHMGQQGHFGQLSQFAHPAAGANPPQSPYPPYQAHPSLNMNIPLGVYPSQHSPTYSNGSAASTPVSTYPSLQQQYLTGHHHHGQAPHPQVQHFQHHHGRVGSPLSTSTQGTASPGPRSPAVPVSPFVGPGGFGMHQQQYMQQQGQYGHF